MTSEAERGNETRPPAGRKAKVAVLFSTPETVLQDYERLMELADYRQHLDPSATTILKVDFFEIRPGLAVRNIFSQVVEFEKL